MTERRYFGTDGVRGIAGRAPMTADFAFRLGVAAGESLRRHPPAPSAPPSTAPAAPRTPARTEAGDRLRVAVGMDTRRSGPMLAHALVAGLASRGVDAVWLGVIPTPGVSRLVVALGCAAGVVVSASHNPFEDNGIKFFDAAGRKLPDARELEIEALLDGQDAFEPVEGPGVGTASRYRTEDGDYLRFLLQHAPYLDGLKVGLDCAHGAAYDIAPRVFKKIGARLDVQGAAPDGLNINVGRGSTQPGALQARVRELELDVGVAFDGDADRAVLVDRRGRLVTGDHVLAICAVARGEREVVATVMTNLGTERWLAERGIALHRTDVGDRYVHEALSERGLTLGGEQSGHVLFLDKAPTGDGILTALQVLSAARSTRTPLEAWMDGIPVYPQTLLNVRVDPERRRDAAAHPDVAAAVEAADARLGAEGRINLRPSGTEPLVRVMVEGRDADEIQAVAREVAAVVERAAGG